MEGSDAVDRKSEMTCRPLGHLGRRLKLPYYADPSL